MSEKISLESVKKTYGAVEKARESDRPFPSHNDDGTIAVYGDANQTELEKFDIIAHFVFVKDELEVIPQGAKTYGRYVSFDMKFDDVFINPRNNLKLLDCLVRIEPFWTSLDDIYDEQAKALDKLNKLDPDYQEKEDKINRDTMLKIAHEYAYAEDDVQNAIYDFVGTFLNLDKYMQDHMSAYSAVECLVTVLAHNPELFNEAEQVFGH